MCGPRGDLRTPLHVSAEHGHAHNVRLLLSEGGTALMTATDGLGLTPMDLAEKGEHKECMQVRASKFKYSICSRKEDAHFLLVRL